MSAKIIDGNAVAEAIEREVAAESAKLAESGRKPKLVAVQVGENPASKMYTKMQQRKCESVGIDYELLNLPDDITPEQLKGRIEQLNGDKAVAGLILQMPLPGHLDARKIQTIITPIKDAEGMHPANMGRLFFGDYTLAPCTPLAAVALLRSVCDDLAGKETVIVGHSEIVGKPIAAILLGSPDKSPTVTVCHIATKDLAAHTQRAEVLIVAAGVSQARWLGYRRAKKAGKNPSVPNLSPLVKADDIKQGAIVIDVAINRIPKGFDDNGEPLKKENGKTDMITVGDVDFEGAKDKVSAITPVPGGVGPVTVAMLLKNTISCAKQQS